jgi:hypothetical protein
VPNQFFSISSTLLKVLDTIQIFPYVIQTDKSFNDLPVCRMTVPVTTFPSKLRDNRKTITVLLHIKSYISF